MPLFNLARLEQDPQRMIKIRHGILRDRHWSHVAAHKNVLFAFFRAANTIPPEDLSGVVADHAAQLDLFPPAPFVELPCDLTGVYEESADCPGKTAVATDLDHRCRETFIWQKDPWELTKEGDDRTLSAGVDYQLAYWLGRRYGFIAEDAPETCLQWRGAPPQN